MKTYVMFFKETENQLGRKLAECEIDFLKWLHAKYENEQNK